MIKNTLMSKTVMVGALTAAIGILNLLAAFPTLKQYSGYILLASGIAVIVLRQMTRTAVSLKAPIKARDLGK